VLLKPLGHLSVPLEGIKQQADEKPKLPKNPGEVNGAADDLISTKKSM
jgi:hypothetical protein